MRPEGDVAGLSAAEHDANTVVTGMLALWLGFGFWWISFDLVGPRSRAHTGTRRSSRRDIGQEQTRRAQTRAQTRDSHRRDRGAEA